jgi:uncharacterized membrane protein
MTALPAPEPDPDAERLRSFVARLSECETIDERDQVMKEVIEDVKELLTRRPGFQRHWLLKLDQINKRFIGHGRLPRPNPQAAEA